MIFIFVFEDFNFIGIYSKEIVKFFIKIEIS